LPYVTIPQRLEKLRAKSALEHARKAGHQDDTIAFVKVLLGARQELLAEIATAEHRLKCVNDLIKFYEQ
jgi:hypothetical protein